LSSLAGTLFEHEERYRELVGRQADLVQALDITKNQASSRLAAETTGDIESVDATPPEAEGEGAWEKQGEAAAGSNNRTRAAAPQTKPTVATVHLAGRRNSRMKIAV
jgi:hypothetical protein